MRRWMKFNCFSFLLITSKWKEWTRIVLPASWLSCPCFSCVQKVIKEKSHVFPEICPSVSFLLFLFIWNFSFLWTFFFVLGPTQLGFYSQQSFPRVGFYPRRQLQFIILQSLWSPKPFKVLSPCIQLVPWSLHCPSCPLQFHTPSSEGPRCSPVPWVNLVGSLFFGHQVVPLLSLPMLTSHRPRNCWCLFPFLFGMWQGLLSHNHGILILLL